MSGSPRGVIMLLAESRIQTILPYLLHLAFVEIRNLAGDAANSAQIAKLADVMEFLPRAFESGCRPIEDFVIREQFEEYRRDFPNSWYAQRYLAILDGLDTPTNY